MPGTAVSMPDRPPDPAATADPHPKDLTGRIALVTGANAGIGRVTAEHLAERGATVLLACRSRERTQPLLDRLRLRHGAEAAHFVPLDLADLRSVRHCASLVLALGLPLHLLILNAGAAGVRGRTVDGFEHAFGVHHVGHFVLTQALLPRLLASAPARVVTVASRAHRMADGIHWEAVRRPTATWLGVREYAVSKLANILFSAELGRRLAGSGVTTYALHPGVVDSEIWRGLPAPLRALNRLRLVSVQEGARTTLYCATAPDLSQHTGRYYSDAALAQPTPIAEDASLAAELWRRTEAWTAPEETAR
jgi:retinol dehydrogenase 12